MDTETFVELDATLRQAGEAGHKLRLCLLQHYSEMLRHLASNLDAGDDPSPDRSVSVDSPPRI